MCKAYSYEVKKKFYYVLINHNIRKNSLREAFQVKKLLKSKKMSLKILSNKIKIRNNIQGKARTIRYEKLKNFCKKNNVKTLITAHNFEDQVETFFIRLSRGSGLHGLSSMKKNSKLDKRLNLFRPLLDVKKKELRKISVLVFGKYLKDSSNRDTKFLRIKIRNLKKHLENSGIKYEQITRSINNLASSKEVLDGYYDVVSKKIIKKVKKKIFINLNKFKKYEQEIKIRIINDIIRNIQNNYYNPRSKKVINLILRLKQRNFTKSALAGCLFEKINNQLCVKSEKG